MASLNQKIKALNGVDNWLNNRGLPNDSRTIGRITAEFLEHKGISHKKECNTPNVLNRASVQNSIKVQDHFSEFTNYVLKKFEEEVQGDKYVLKYRLELKIKMYIK